jgi:hypothetical protein
MEVDSTSRGTKRKADQEPEVGLAPKRIKVIYHMPLSKAEA